MTYSIHEGDVSAVLPTLAPENFDACLCDPPYGLSFMGKHWDHGVPASDVWASALRVLKPGAHLLAFGGTRTFHRLAVAIEDAGFEIRDTVMWVYGSGFPKSLDIAKQMDKSAGVWRVRATRPESANGSMSGPNYGRTPKGTPIHEDARKWEGYGTALKPAWEPVIVAMKPTQGTYAENALTHGVAGLNVDDARLAARGETQTQGAYQESVVGIAGPRDAGKEYGADLGRWPANVIHDGSPEVMELFPGTEAFRAARFFYCAKASREEREACLGGGSLPKGADSGGALRDGGRTTEVIPIRDLSEIHGDKLFAVEWDRTSGVHGKRVRNHHPTVKPLDLCRYLATLIIPPARETPRRLLVPFSGSGSEMIGGLLAGWDHVEGIERESEYVQIAHARLKYWTVAA